MHKIKFRKVYRIEQLMNYTKLVFVGIMPLHEDKLEMLEAQNNWVIL